MPVFDLRPERGEAIELVSDYSATDDATPLTVDDSQASTGDLTVTFDQRGRPADWKRLKGQKIQVQVTGRSPRPLGTVAHVSGGDGAVSLAIDTVLNRMAVVRRARPQTGTLGALVTYWAHLCGIDAASVQVDARIASVPIAAVGFYDNVWLRLKQFAAATGIEVVGRDNAIVVRPPRPVQLFVDDDLLVSSQWDVDDTTLAQQIEVVYYEPKYVDPGEDTPDFSRSDRPVATADDPFTFPTARGRIINSTPPGYAGGKRGIT